MISLSIDLLVGAADMNYARIQTMFVFYSSDLRSLVKVEALSSQRGKFNIEFYIEK